MNRTRVGRYKLAFFWQASACRCFFTQPDQLRKRHFARRLMAILGLLLTRMFFAVCSVAIQVIW
jgi:hypothetical protein